MSEKLLVPDIGDFEEVEVIEVLAKVGDQLNINDPVITIESDKSSVEIPSTVSGKIELVAVKVGDKVSKGDLILSITSSGENKKSVPIPKDTESIIKQAEVAMTEKKEEVVASKEPAQKKEQSIIQVTNGSDIDPLVTQDWLEILGCGMVNPKVLENCNIDSSVYQGFAFGMGIERLSMLKYGITDMRGLFDLNIKWLDHYGFSPLDLKTRSEI